MTPIHPDRLALTVQELQEQAKDGCLYQTIANFAAAVLAELRRTEPQPTPARPEDYREALNGITVPDAELARLRAVEERHLWLGKVITSKVRRRSADGLPHEHDWNIIKAIARKDAP